MMLPWVGFANRPLSFSATHKSQAVLLSGVSLMSTAFSSPRPLTDLMRGLLSTSSFIASRKRWPSFRAFCAKCSSATTDNASVATTPATGLPPKVDPCWPGWMTPMTGSSANTAETG